MAISPPSDILLDVAAAANPAKVQAAKARLAMLAADPGASNAGFSAALSQAKDGLGGGSSTTAARSSEAASLGGSSSPAATAHRAAGHGKPSVYTKFEAVLLQSFVEAMLPKDADLFGDKMSADAYRSMMAEQFANQIANAGGIGLAKSIEAAHPATPRIATSLSS